MPRRVAVGVVTGDKTQKTRRVEIPRLVKHAKYGKYLRQRTVCYVHDENNESRNGDTVEIVESRPMSRTKRWQLVRVVTKSRLVDLATLRSAARGRPGAEGSPVDAPDEGTPEVSPEGSPETPSAGS